MERKLSRKLCNLSHGLDLDLNGKRPSVASDGNFSSYLIGSSDHFLWEVMEIILFIHFYLPNNHLDGPRGTL